MQIFRQEVWNKTVHSVGLFSQENWAFKLENLEGTEHRVAHDISEQDEHGAADVIDVLLAVAVDLPVGSRDKQSIEDSVDHASDEAHRLSLHKESHPLPQLPKLHAKFGFEKFPVIQTILRFHCHFFPNNGRLLLLIHLYESVQLVLVFLLLRVVDTDDFHQVVSWVVQAPKLVVQVLAIKGWQV